MAVKPIIISLVADTSGLQVGIEALEALGKVDKTTADQFRAVNKAFQDRGKVLDESVTATERFVDATKKAAQATTGGAIIQTTENIKKLAEQLKLIPSYLQPGMIQKQVEDISKQFAAGGLQIKTATENAKKFTEVIANVPSYLTPGGFQNSIKTLITQFTNGKVEIDALNSAINLTKKALQGLDPASKEFQKLQKELEASIIVNERLNKSFTSSRGELRAMREALTELEDGGHEGTKVFQNLAIAAGQLDDQVGDTQARIKTLASDTFKFDAAIQAVQGVAGAFSIAQGAAALLGNENEDLQQGLLRVNAAMAVLNGLQQIQQLLQKQSAVYIAAEIALQKISVLQTNLQAAAESRFTVVRYAAIAAQGLLNDVMAANPAGLLLLALGAVAGALLIFSNNSDKAADSQEDLAEATRKLNERLNEELIIQEGLRNSRIGGLNTLQQEIAVLQASGAARSKILALESRALDEQIYNAKVRRATYSGDVASIKEFDQANEEVLKLQLERRTKDLEAQKAAADEGEEISKKAIEDRKKALQAFLKDQVAANEAAVIEAKAGFEKLVAQIALIQSKARLDLATTDLGPNERLAIELKAGEDIKKAREDLLGDLEKAGVDHNTRLTKIDNDRLLDVSKNAQDELAIRQKQADDELKIIQARIEREKQQRTAARDFVIQSAGTLAASLNEISQNQTNGQIAELQRELDAKLISQEQYDRAVKKLQHDQAVRDKQNALFQAFIQQSLAVLKVLSDQSIPVFLRPIYIAATVATALAQIAAIQSRPIPAYAKGTKNAKGGPSLVGEAGPELFYANGQFGYADKPTVLNLPKGAKVIPTLETGKILERYNIPMPNIQHNVSTTYGGIKIDYNKLGAVIGKQIEKLPLQINQWDGNGFSNYQTSLSQRKSYLNKRYSSK